MTKVLLNAKGTCGEISPELKGFLELVAGSEDAEEGTFADRIQRQVRKARHNAAWREEYMDWEMTLRNERYKGYEEGKAAGIETGILTQQITMLVRQMQKGNTLETAAENLCCAPEELKPVWEAVAAAGPTYSVEEILQKLK